MGLTTVLLAPAAGLVGAFALLFVALRGRRADEHPYCRRCRFDLFGKPADSTVCSECGADLGRRRAVRVGRRVRRRRVLAIAVPALLLAAGWLGFVGWGAARGVDWNRRKPVWWLASDAGGRDAGRRDAALAELTRRLGAGELPADKLAAVADRGLAYQADATAPWAPAWGDFLEKAHRAGRLPEDRWRRYGRQALRPRLIVPGFVRRGEALAVNVCPDPPRMAAGRWFACRVFLREVAVDGVPVCAPAADDDKMTGGWSGCLVSKGRPRQWTPNAELPAAKLAALSDGTHMVRCTYRLLVRDKLGKADPPLADETLQMTAPFLLLPADAAAPAVAGPTARAGEEDGG